ncbi:MAG: ferrochelatase [Candidatus Andeanibacterium colombiense]|uniref:Ferrochelatase n=1 Tax=Candidatus Andeanibacterium colombiense TaxID=3121345 RepID=A0AAJ6BNX9_9SPHN|nr:MAG: ferrochelatase [Sphingomonadaceae bacterium]
MTGAAFSGIGVLLVNLGTPDAPTSAAVKRYLREFLSDPRVVEIPAIVWQPILRSIVLNTRPKKSAHAYSQVWTDKGSPLAAFTALQAEMLQARLGNAALVRWGMRYGNPALGTELQALQAAGCERILIAPMYPQYSAATNASVSDKLSEALGAMRAQPALRNLPPYYNDPLYIDALAKDLGRQLDALPFAPEVLLLSFHGLPERCVELGDPYQKQCLETARLLKEAMAPRKLRIDVTFQSRFGKAKWLEPATDTVLEAEAKAGIKRLAVAAPGFSVDCLETLEELGIRGKEQFLEAGGEDYATLACLNAGEPGMDMLEALVRRELGGWI